MPDNRHTCPDVQAFNQWAATYADIYAECSHSSYFLKRRQELVLNMLAGGNPGDVLDVGCGPGMMAPGAVKLGNRFHGVDISPAMIAECRRLHRQVKQASFSVGSVQQLAFANASFAAVLCMGVLEYLSTEEINEALTEMVRVLQPGGLLVLSCHNFWSPYFLGERFSAMWKRALGRLGPQPRIDQDLPTRQFKPRDMAAELCRAGLEEDSSRYFGFNLMPRRFFDTFPVKSRALSGHLERLQSSPLGWLGLGVLLTARKPAISSRSHATQAPLRRAS